MEAVWSPSYFGIGFAITATNTSPPPPPPPAGGSPAAANVNWPYEQLKVAA